MTDLEEGGWQASKQASSLVYNRRKREGRKEKKKRKERKGLGFEERGEREREEKEKQLRKLEPFAEDMLNGDLSTRKGLRRHHHEN